MRREFGDLQNLPQDPRSVRKFCGPQTFFAWDLDSMHSSTCLPLDKKNLNCLSKIDTPKPKSYKYAFSTLCHFNTNLSHFNVKNGQKWWKKCKFVNSYVVYVWIVDFLPAA